MHIVLGALIGFLFGFKGLIVMFGLFLIFVLLHAYQDKIRTDAFMKSLEEDRNRPARKTGGMKL